MDLLSDILSNLNLKGTLYFRTSFTPPWSVKVPPYQNVARFHFAHKGRCFVRIQPDQSPVLLEQGDLVMITGGAEHTLFCTPETENKSVSLDQVIEESGFTGSGTLVYGDTGTDHETQLVCGHFAFDEQNQNLFLDALPPFIHLKNYGEATGTWMENTLKVIGNEAGKNNLGADLIATNMSEIIFTQAIRAYSQTVSVDTPVLSCFADDNIARALTAVHNDPGDAWTLERLAQIAGMSRTAFSTRFSKLMTLTPLAYITYWRMQIAQKLLTTSNDPIISIAEKVGYQSEAAFSRVFKKHHLTAPATFRRQAQLVQ